MSALEFISHIISSLAWPLTILLILLVLRKQLGELLLNLQRLKVKDVEMNFGSEASKVIARAQAVLPLPRVEAHGTVTSTVESRRERLAQITPRANILEAWLEIEAAALKAITRHNPDLKPPRLASPMKIAMALQRLGLLNGAQLELFHNLRNLRNSAAHAMNFNVGMEAVEEYVEAAGRLTQFLKAS